MWPILVKFILIFINVIFVSRGWSVSIKEFSWTFSKTFEYYLLPFSLFVILPVERVLVICRITFYAICCPVLRNFFHIIGEQRNLRNNKKKNGDGPWNVLSIYLLSRLIFFKNIFSNYWKTLYFHNLWFSLKKNMYIVHVGLFLWFEEFCSTCQLDFESQIN